ncbi:MAG: hypothetical protein WCI55_14125 [Armatimonadota bacterium]
MRKRVALISFGLIVVLVLGSTWYLRSRQLSATDKLAKIENIDQSTLKQIFDTGDQLAKSKPIAPEQWDYLVLSSNDRNPQLRQEAFSAMSEARTNYYREKALREIERMKTDVDTVRCFYVGHLIALKSEKWKTEADVAMNDKSESVRLLAKDAVTNVQSTWLSRLRK